MTFPITQPLSIIFVVGDLTLMSLVGECGFVSRFVQFRLEARDNGVLVTNDVFELVKSLHLSQAMTS